MIANICDLKVGEFVHTLGDAHLYNNHLEQAEEQLSRKPLEPPKIIIKARESIDDLPDSIEKKILLNLVEYTFSREH